jgi:hypothetical protein
VSDPLGGTPIRDHPGTVRGDAHAGAWVKVGRVGSAEQDSWVDTTRGERVSDYAMWLMKLPVVGVVPGSLADHNRQHVDKTRAEMLDGFLVSVREYLAADPMIEPDSDDEILSEFVEIIHTLSERARAAGVSLLQAARGNRPPGDPCPNEQCLLVAGHSGPHHLEDVITLQPQCGDVGGPDKANPRVCIYPDGHPGLHSFEPLVHGEPRCQNYGDRPCWYPEGHECRHSYEGKCRERAADGTLCDLSEDHEAQTPHDWMSTFGNPNIRCRTIWRQARSGYTQVWRCMFPAGHAGPCSFELRMNLLPRCPVVNEAGARCWDLQGHNDWHRYLEATRERR